MSAHSATPAGEITLRCTVRGCSLPLTLARQSAHCPAGHAFDRARSGYWNLLQPQDRRSATPGDGADVVAARRRLFDRGLYQPLLLALVEHGALLAPGALLDVGCGEGSILNALGAALGREAHGVDLSTAAIALAARSFPAPTWVIANADRGLPYADGAFAGALSITARRPAAELRRVLRADGLLLVSQPAPDDLAELRARVLADARPLGGASGAAEELAPWFEPLRGITVSRRIDVDADTAADLLRATYRGQRTSQSGGLAGAATLGVTLALRLQTFRPRR